MLLHPSPRLLMGGMRVYPVQNNHQSPHSPITTIPLSLRADPRTYLTPEGQRQRQFAKRALTVKVFLRSFSLRLSLQFPRGKRNGSPALFRPGYPRHSPSMAQVSATCIHACRPAPVLGLPALLATRPHLAQALNKKAAGKDSSTLLPSQNPYRYC